MFIFPLSLIFIFSVISCYGTSEHFLVDTNLYSDGKVNTPPLHVTLMLTNLHKKSEVLLKAALTKTFIDSSNILIYSSEGSKPYKKPLTQCFYEVVPHHKPASQRQQWLFSSGRLSFCENGIRGHLRASWSSRYPTGAVYHIEPANPVASNRLKKGLSWSLEHLHKPHRLTIVPIIVNNRSTSSQSRASSQWSNRSNWTADSANNSKSDPLTYENNQPPVSADSSWSNQERLAVDGLRDTIQSTIHTSFHRSRQRRASPVLEPNSPESPHLEPIRVFQRPNQTQPYLLELYLVVDEVLTSAFRGNYDRLIYRVNMLMALVNSLYAPFNINIVVVQLELWEHDRSQLKVEEHHLLATLAQFKRMHTTVRHDCLHALLGIKDEASRTRGHANHQTMCVYSRCVGYSRDSPRIELAETARTIAHELGHNFGLRHDTEECKCQGCIMATGVEFGNNIMEWSPCSIEDLPTMIEFGMGVCLGDVPARSIVSISSVLLNESARTPGRINNKQANPTGPVTSVVQVYNWMKQLTPLAVYHAYSSSGKPRRGQDPSAVTEILSAGLCGNGQLDPGEECDCGSSTSCPEELRDCCDVDRCRLKPGSECAGGPCCFAEPLPQVLRSRGDRYRCRLRQAGTICRKESGSCDLPEYCDGKSQWCPIDVYKADGVPCRTNDGSGAYCIRGGCRNADGWCRTLWGDTARRGATECFYENHVWNLGDKPDPVANCGKYRPPQTDRWEDAKSWPGIACQSWQDAECGRLWCSHRNEKAMLHGWIDSRTTVLRSGDICYALVYDPVWPASDRTTWDANVTLRRQSNLNSAGVGIYAANTQDAGMVPDGTPCSRGLCYNGTCTNVYDLPSTVQCDCNGQGLCNNLGHCHCKPGFHPPHCEYGGDGGSIDSGPPPPVHRFSSSSERRTDSSPGSLLPPWAPPTWFYNLHPALRGPSVVTTKATSTITTTTPETPRRTTPDRARFSWPSFTSRPLKPSYTWPKRRRPVQSSHSRNHSRLHPTRLDFTTPVPRSDDTPTKYAITNTSSTQSTSGIANKNNDLSPDPMLVIALCLVFFIALPLVVLLTYWYVYHRCSFRHLLGSPTIVQTESGLRKPFDRGLVACIRQCCRFHITRHRSSKGSSYMCGTEIVGSYPILAYAQDGSKKPLTNGCYTNGHCVSDAKKSNSRDTEIVMSNGMTHHQATSKKSRSKTTAKSDRTVLISQPTDLNQIQLNGNMFDSEDIKEHRNTLGTNRMAKMWEDALSRKARIEPVALIHPNHSTNEDCTAIATTKQIVTLCNLSEDTEPQSIVTVQISQPQLKAMTYQGEMCSLNEARSTLKRGEKRSKMNNTPQTPVSTLKRTSTLRSAVQQPVLPQNYHYVTVNRSQSQRTGLSPSDISNPKLENTTYTEALTDLETVRQQRGHLPHAPTLSDKSNPRKSTSHRLL